MVVALSFPGAESEQPRAEGRDLFPWKSEIRTSLIDSLFSSPFKKPSTQGPRSFPLGSKSSLNESCFYDKLSPRLDQGLSTEILIRGRGQGGWSVGPWVDAHCHLADPRWDGERHAVLEEALEKGFGFFLQGGVGPEDWSRQQELRKQFPQAIGLCFGLHPYWVAEHDEDLCEIALDSLAAELPKAMALGETGLDFRPHIMRDSRERQIDCFQQQLELAQMASLPVVLHLVQAHDEALRIFDLWGVPDRRGMVHSFNSSWPKAEELIRRGLFLSIGGPVARPDNTRLHQAVREMPLEFLLIETDSPDQPSARWKGQKNPPSSLWEVAEVIALLRKMTPVEILDITTANFHRLFGAHGTDPHQFDSTRSAT